MWPFSAQALVFHVVRGPFETEFYQCVIYGSFVNELQLQAYAIFTFAFTFIIPLIVIIVLYTAIYIILYSECPLQMIKCREILRDVLWTVKLF